MTLGLQASHPCRAHVTPEPDLPRERAPATTRLKASWARHDDEVRAAQSLRWRVFTEELGARPASGKATRLDADLFDAHCEHLLVHTLATDAHPARLVGTCRVLTPYAAQRVGGFSLDGEFDLVRLRHLRPRMAELGRACIDPQWRRAGVAAKLSHSLLRFVQDNRLECVVAGASVPMYDGGQLAARLWRQLLSTVPVALDEQVRPRLPLPVDRLQTQAPVAMPALILCYLRFGARLIGPPAWNIDSGSAELPMMLRLADLPHLRRRPFPGR